MTGQFETAVPMSRLRLLAVVLLLTTGLSAQEHAPLPDTLVSANTVYLINDSGDLKAYDAFYKQLTKWGRLKVVSSRDAADVVAVLTSSASYTLAIGTGTAVTSGNVTSATSSAVSVPSSVLHLRVFQAGGGEPVWLDSTEKWLAAGHAPSKLVDNLKKRMPRSK